MAELKLYRTSDDRPGDFAVSINGKKIFFLPYAVTDGDKTLTIDVSVSSLVFQCTAEELAIVSDIYTEYRNEMHTYYDLCVNDNPSYPYSRKLLERVLRFQLTASETRAVKRMLEQLTCIYLIRDHGTGLTKIGRSSDPEKRLRQLIKQDTLMPTPNDFSILVAWEDYPYKEITMHNHYAEKRVRGEWFSLDDDDMAYISRIFVE